jgi:hypothetical protein
MIRAELKAGEHLPTESWRKDVVRALDLLEAELRGCDDYPGFFKRANGGGNSLNGHSVVLYDRLGDKLNFFGEYQTASPLVASGRYLLITTWVRDFVDPRHLVTPLEGLHKGVYKASRTEESTGMVKLREDWLKLLYGQADVCIISEMMGCGAIPPEVELYLDLRTMLHSAGKVVGNVKLKLFPFAEAANMSPDYYAMLTETLLEVLDEVHDLDAYGDDRSMLVRVAAWFRVRNRIEENAGAIRDLVAIANRVLKYRNNDDLAKIVWLIQHYKSLAAAIAV